MRRVAPVPRFWGPGIQLRFGAYAYDDRRDLCNTGGFVAAVVL